MLQFRPHHFLCTLGFQGKGYSAAFVKNFQNIANHLRDRGTDGDSVVIEVVDRTDSICSPCPSRTGSLCTSEKKIQDLDSAHAKILGIRNGERLSWGDAKKRISAEMTIEKFETACAPCAWKSLGVCKAALLKLKGESN